MDAINDFSQLDAQDGISRLTVLSPAELAEANQYYDELQAKLDAELENPQFTSEWPGATSEERWQAKYDYLMQCHVEVGAALAERLAYSDRLDKIGDLSESNPDSACHGLRVGDDLEFSNC